MGARWPLRVTVAVPSRFHFISGLPRSGSTLLAALLRQNPRFHARMSSPVARLFQLMMSGMSEEGANFISDEQRARVLLGLFESYYADAGRPVIFDTNRTWTARLPALLTLWPNARVICMVRNVAWIMDSIERLVRANPFARSRLFGDEAERANVYSRTEALAARQRLVGSAWTNLKEAYYGAQAGSLLVVEYGYLTRAPAKTLELIYQFLGEAPFTHDFENVEYDEPEFDAALATPGLHKVGPIVRFEPRRTLLPPDLVERYSALSFWKDPAPSLAHSIAPGHTAPAPKDDPT
jgi:sulfotransferase